MKKGFVYRALVFWGQVCLLFALTGCEQPGSPPQGAALVAVTGITGSLQEKVPAGYPLDLNSYVTVEPEDAARRTIAWSIPYPHAFGITTEQVAGGRFTPDRPGTMALTATITGGAGTGDFVKNGYQVEVVSEEAFVPASDIEGVPTAGYPNIPIDLSAARVLPEDATYRLITWSVTDAGATGASVQGSLLTASAAGTLTLRGTVSNPKTAPYTKDFTLTIRAAPVSWTKVANIPAQMPKEIQTVCYGKETFVAGSRENDGRIAWSTDGIHWTGLDNVTTTFGTNFVHVRFLSGKFWAVGGGGHMARSTDGKTWTAVENPEITLNIVDIAYGNGVFVAVGESASMSYSEDGGTTWNANNQAEYFEVSFLVALANFKAIEWGGGKFLAVGQLCRAIYSTDGIHWTNISSTISTRIAGAPEPPDAGGWYGLSVATYGNGLYIAATQGRLLLSRDCETWEAVDMEETGFPRGFRYGWINCLIYAEGLYILGGGDGGSAWSADGRNWTSTAKGETGSNRIFHNFHFINGLAYGDGKLVGVGATCTNANCPNKPTSTKESDHAGNAGCAAWAALE
jgi:photosystem II stability/assembly factor-like uncharacterized protein